MRWGWDLGRMGKNGGGMGVVKGKKLGWDERAEGVIEK